MLAEQNSAIWFVNLSGSPAKVRAEVSWVLDAWSSDQVPDFRVGGEDRFLRYRFYEYPPPAATSGFGVGKTLLKVKPDAQCSVVAAVREQVMLAAGISDPKKIAVGRECDAGPMATVPPAYTGIEAWHREALLATNPEHPNLSAINVALLDDFGPPAITATSITHGAAVENLVRDVAPGVEILEYRTIEDDFTTTDRIAASLDDAIRVAYESRRPTIINLSLGWPPHKSVRTPLEDAGSKCATYEDGIGESVFYVLDVARRLDDRAQPNIAVFSAAGNRWLRAREQTPGMLEVAPYQMPTAVLDENYDGTIRTFPRSFDPGREARFTLVGGYVPPGLNVGSNGSLTGRPAPSRASPGLYDFTVEVEHSTGTTRRTLEIRVVDPGSCAENPSVPTWFYPAQLFDRTLCRLDSDSPRRLSAAVGAVDHRFQTPANSLQFRPAPLVAPGTYVQVGRAGASSPPGSTTAATARAFFLNGTSASTALVSGLAAGVQARALATYGRTFDFDTVLRVLLASGRDCNGSFMPLLEVIDAAFSCPAAMSSGQNALGGTTLTGGCIGPNATPSTCRSAITSCTQVPTCEAPATRLQVLGSTPSGTMLTPSATPRPDWTRNYDFEPAPGASPPEPDGVALGSAGPQPEDPGCSLCFASPINADRGVYLELSFNSTYFGGDYQLEDPVLLVGVPGLGEPLEVPLHSPPGPSPITSRRLQMFVGMPLSARPASANQYGLRTRVRQLSTLESYLQTEPVLLQ